MSWVHDNILLSYSVDLAARCIQLNTVCEHSDIPENTVVRFTNVIAHHFEGAMKTNILNDITRHEPVLFIERYADSLDDWARCGVPYPAMNADGLLDMLTADKQSYFLIADVCGMSGWVLAKAMTITVNGEEKSYE